MREIKFRAWDKTKQVMVYDGDTKWMHDAYPVNVTNLGIKFCKKLNKDTSIKDENGIVGYTSWEFDMFAWKNIELMQFTGLHDKNGKEIYEGDIVTITTNHISDIAPDREPTTSTVEVKFEKAMFIFGDMTMNYRPLQKARLEIIGNIYETPELLKGAK